jgi:hypothetical protein
MTMVRMQVYVVGDNYRLVPRSSTLNVSVSSAAAAAGGGSGGSDSSAAAAPLDVLPFDSSHLRTSSKKEKGDANPLFASFPLDSASTLHTHAPPAPVIQALLREIRKLDISLCVVHSRHPLHVTRHTSHVTRHTSHVTRLCFFSYGLDLIRDETDGNF